MKKLDKKFIEYVWDTYKPNSIRGKKFNHKLKKIEVVIAASLMKEYCRKEKQLYCGDTDDRLNTAELIIHLFNYPYKPMKFEHSGGYYDDVVRQRMIKNIIIFISNEGFYVKEEADAEISGDIDSEK
jgi:hypothetical protein